MEVSTLKSPFLFLKGGQLGGQLGNLLFKTDQSLSEMLDAVIASQWVPITY